MEPLFASMWMLLTLADVTFAYNSAPCQQRHSLLPVGRQCQRSCVDDSDCRSKRKSCLCDGVCGLSCIRHGQTCEPLPEVSNGKVFVENVNFGAIARYVCEAGYKPRGDQARVCQGDEKWSGVAPQCLLDYHIEKVACGQPPEVVNAVHNGHPDRKSYELGTMLQYECLSDFAKSRDAVVRAWCVGGGVWVGPTMTCSNAGCPQMADVANGRVEQPTENVVGSRAAFHCDPGYFLTGRPEVTCQGRGKWDGEPPTCEKVMCQTPPDVDHAVHDGHPEQILFTSGSQVTYTCAHGYSADGDARATCGGNGEWLELTLMCTPRSCGHPGDIENGWRTGYAFTYPNRVNYYCHEGFLPHGANFRDCQANGTWAGQVPKCEPVSCPQMFAPTLGRMYGTGNTFGTVIRFECDLQHRVVGSSERRCQADRTWSGTPTRCEEINCGWPGPFYNGYLIGGNTKVGSIIFYSCKTHATFDGHAFQTRCLETGQWSDPPPICWNQCQVPDIPSATILNVQPDIWVNHNTTLEYRCKTGFRTQDDHLRMRCENGSWSASPVCLPAPCSQQPPHVHNGMRVFFGNQDGDQARYICFPGYRLAGINGTYLTCSLGHWVGGSPYCEEYYCPNPGSISHGKVLKKIDNTLIAPFESYIKRIKHGHKLVFQCHVGYTLKGPGGATCVDGVWQPPIADSEEICAVAIHPPFRNLWKPIRNKRL